MSRVIALFQRIFLARRGRPVALVILMVVLSISYLAETQLPPNIAKSWVGRGIDYASTPFNSGRRLLFDGYQRLFPRERQSQPVTIVEIDEASLARIGQWPWPRNRLADLVDAIAAHQPAAIGLDMYMPEPDQTSPEQVANNIEKADGKLAQALRQLPSHEARLAQALKAAPTVIGAAGFDFKTATSSTGLRLAPIITSNDPLPYLRKFPWVLASLPELQAAAHGQALLSVGLEDGLVRKLPLVMAVGEQPAPSLALEMLRVATGGDHVQINTGSHGIESVQVADVTIPTQTTGETWLHFARYTGSDASRVSAVDVLEGKVASEVLAQKLVLVGLTGTGLNDMRSTPLGELVPGIEIQAQVIESIFDGRFLLRPLWLKHLELFVFASFGLLMIWQIPHTHTRLAKLLASAPSATTWLVLSLNLMMILLGYVLFYSTGLLLDAASMFIGLSSVLGSLVSSAMIEISRENQRLEHEQQQMREAAARVAGELAAARRIQLGSLPNADLVLANEKRVTVATLLEPAREVGGDLYDLFMIDDHRLCFVVGDVSGKGIPAGLFMAVTKTLAKSFAMRLNAGLADVVTNANRELANENPEMLFVTLLIGCIDLENGQLQLVNAGHDAPWRITSTGEVEQFTPAANAGGPPLCVVDDFDYAMQTVALHPGDTLCVVTDGITEAMNNAGDCYGTRRLEDALAKSAAIDNPRSLIANIRDDVATFVAGAEASDDMTLLVLNWKGSAGFLV